MNFTYVVAMKTHGHGSYKSCLIASFSIQKIKFIFKDTFLKIQLLTLGKKNTVYFHFKKFLILGKLVIFNLSLIKENQFQNNLIDYWLELCIIELL